MLDKGLTARNGGRNARKECYREAWVIKPIARLAARPQSHTIACQMLL